MLSELLDLVLHYGLEGVARGENVCRAAELDKEDLARRGLHLDAQKHAADGARGFIVHCECARERLAELDGAEGGGKGEELGHARKVAQSLRVARERSLALEREDGGGGVCREGRRAGVEGLPGARQRGPLLMRFDRHPLDKSFMRQQDQQRTESRITLSESRCPGPSISSSFEVVVVQAERR